MQLQIHDAEQIIRRAGATEPAGKEFLQAGDALAITDGPVPEGKSQTAWIRIKSEVQQVIAAEVWTIGQRIYWLDAGQVFTNAATDACVGFAGSNAPDLSNVANESKNANDKSAWITFNSNARKSNTIATIDFGATIDGVVNALGLIAGGPAANGRYTLRNYATEPAGTGQFSGLFFTHNGALAPSGATVQLGTTADPDAFMLATDMTALLALGDPFERVGIALPAAATVIAGTEVIMTITAADATGGKAKFELVNTLI